MAIVDTVRPYGTYTAGGWTIVPSGTAHGVLSDDDNATYVLQGTGNLEVRCGPHTLTSGYRRHRARIRFRGTADGSGGSLEAQVRFLTAAAGSTWIGGPQAFSFPGDSVWTEYTMAWRGSASMPTTGNLSAGTAPTLMARFGQAAGVNTRVSEVWLDIDTRHAPTFTPTVVDGADVDRTNGTVTDTAVPRIVFGPIDYDGLPARDWHIVVYTLTQTLTPGFSAYDQAWVNQSVALRGGAGAPPGAVGIPLVNDDYVAYPRVRSNVGSAAQAFPTVESVAFEMATVPPDPPAEVEAIVDEDRAAVDVCWDLAGTSPGSPGGAPWDDSTLIVAEVQRSGCGGGDVIPGDEWVTIQNVAASPDGCWRDRFMPLVDAPLEDCHGDSPGDCMVQYRVRYWGAVGTFTMVTDWTYAEPVRVFNPTPGNAWLRHPVDGALDMSICVTESYARIRPFSAQQVIGGGLPVVVTGDPGGRDYTLAISVRTIAEQAQLEQLLAAPLVYYQPVRDADTWQAPNSESVQVVKVRDIRATQVTMVAVAPQPIDPIAVLGS